MGQNDQDPYTLDFTTRAKVEKPAMTGLGWTLAEGVLREVQHADATMWHRATRQGFRRSPTTTAGTPATMAHPGTSFVTTAPMATTA